MMTKIDPKTFAARYKSSGLSQKQFAQQENMSAPMVSYYLRKARQSDTLPSEVSKFRQVVVDQSSNEYITITTERGLKIEIPI